jgi:predicted AlkP superfamily pyrophosphatase or phosphodiesterase
VCGGKKDPAAAAEGRTSASKLDFCGSSPPAVFSRGCRAKSRRRRAAAVVVDAFNVDVAERHRSKCDGR